MNKIGDITVVIACKNYEKQLQYFLRTIQNQILYPKRIIVVDDAGDNPEFCKKVCKNFNVDYIRNNKHDGENTPRHPLQIGIDKVKENPTEFVLISGADGYWLPNKLLQEYTEITKSKNIGAVFGNLIRAENNFMKQTVVYRKFTKNLFPDNKLYNINKDELLQGCIVTDEALTRFECYKLINYKFRDDVHRNFMWDLWLNISEHYQINFINTFVSAYWIHGENISCTWNTKSEEFLRLRKIIVDPAKKRRRII